MSRPEWIIAAYLATILAIVAFAFWIARVDNERQRDCIREHGSKTVTMQGKGGPRPITVCATDDD